MKRQTFPNMPHPKRWHKPISWLLWLANSDAPNWFHHRHSFYALKDKILSHQAAEVGLDWQRITKDCWGCYGTGYYTHYSGDKDICYRCYGSGVYATYYVKLHRLAFGGRVFHRPGESQSHEPETSREVIHGRIRHKSKGWRAVAAFVVLLAIFDRPKLRRLSRMVATERWRRISNKVKRWLPIRCHACKCLMIRKDAQATLSGYGGKMLGVLCCRCSDEVPF